MVLAQFKIEPIVHRYCLQRGSYFVEVVGTLAKNAQTPIDLGKGRKT
jgi:hypothetical protein